MPEPNVLRDIVERKAMDLRRRFEGLTLSDVRGRAEPTRRSLREALKASGARFILEVKRQSPSEGPLRQAADPKALAAGYRGIADAMSVLTDEPFFGGSLDDLEAVRSAFDGPILAKDFFIDLRQVAEVRARGADAILVMLSVLDDSRATAMLAEAERLNMDAIVEVHDEAQLRRALGLGAKIVGINNRDLRTLETDLNVTERLAPLIPAGRLAVSESGIRTRDDVERLAPHADAFLVGSSLMTAPDPAQAARALAFGRVKVCGITCARDADRAIAAGARFVGLVLVPGTPRAIAAGDAERLLAATSAQAPAVGVFRNEKLLEVASIARALKLAAVQLHGEEPPDYVRGLRSLLPQDCELWAASAVGEFVPSPRFGADRVVFDTKVGSRSGGTGRVFDWEMVRNRPELSSALLAGGLDPVNARAASRIGAFALDVGSGVERAPGRKDSARLAAFFEALRPGSRAEARQCG